MNRRIYFTFLAGTAFTLVVLAFLSGNATLFLLSGGVRGFDIYMATRQTEAKPEDE